MSTPTFHPPLLSSPRMHLNCNPSSNSTTSPQTLHPPAPPTRIVLCHTQADFDTLATALALSKLHHSHIVLPTGPHPTLKRYLNLYKSLFPILSPKLIHPQSLSWIGVADTSTQSRLGPCASWLSHAEEIYIVDHHVREPCDIPYTNLLRDAVGAATTLVVEQIQRQNIPLTSAESTLLALGIHADTGSLTFDTTTPRDAQALAWLLSKGACQRTISQFARIQLTQQQQRLLSNALQDIHTVSVQGTSVGKVTVHTDSFADGMSQVAHTLLEVADVDVLILAVCSPRDISLIARANAAVDGVDLGAILRQHGGGGHPRAASVRIKGNGVEKLLDDVVQQVVNQLPPEVHARDIMTKTVTSVGIQASMEEAGKVLFESGHTGLPVVDEQGYLKGVVSRRDTALAQRRGKSETPVTGWMKKRVLSVSEDTGVREVERILVEQGIGRVPVVKQGVVVGIVTRSDVLRVRQLAGE